MAAPIYDPETGALYPTDDPRRPKGGYAKPPTGKPRVVIPQYTPPPPTIRPNDVGHIPGIEGRSVIPTDRLLEQVNTFIYDGLIDSDGQVMNAISRRQLAEGRMRHASPTYWRYLDSLNTYATMYPTADPRVWVPLAKAMVDPDSPTARDAIAADADRLAGLNGYDKPKNGTTRRGAPTATDEGDDNPGFLSQTIGAIGGFVGGLFGMGPEADLAEPRTTEGLETLPEPSAEDATSDAPWDDTAGIGMRKLGEGIETGYNRLRGDAPTPLDNLASGGNPVAPDDAILSGQRDSVKAFQNAVKYTFSAAMMPLQAYVQGAPASISGDLEDGDYKSALLHAYGAIPFIEAAFIGAENVTDTEFYREGGEEQTVWSQSDFGQVILDLFGQGGQEQFQGADTYNDPAGIQHPIEGGFLPHDPEVNVTPGDEGGTAQQFQRAARLNANTIVPEQDIDTNPEDLAKLQRLARMQGPEEAIEWAAEQGYVWDPVEKSLQRPAQGWTIGRFSALTFGADPYTTRYNNISGTIDFLGNFLDPTLYVPVGTARGAVSALRGGKELAGGGITVSKATDIIAGTDDLIDDLAKGVSVADIERKHGGTFEFYKYTKESGGYTIKTMRPEDLDTMVKDAIDNGYAADRESALLGLHLDGYNWELRGSHFEDVLTEDQVTAKLASADKNPWETNPNLVERVTTEGGGINADDPSVIGFVRTDLLDRMPYSDVDVAKAMELSEDVATNGVREPIVIRFDPETRLAALDDGVHRLQALRANGEYWAPVRVVKGPVTDEQGIRMFNAKAPVRDADEMAVWTDEMHPRHIFGNTEVWSDRYDALTHLAKDYKGTLVSTKATEFWNSRKGIETARAIAEMTSPVAIWIKSGRRFTMEQAVQLARAATPADVIETIAPKLGTTVRRENDLLRFVDTTRLPSYTIRDRLWNVTDTERLADDVPASYNYTSLIPDRGINTEDIEGAIDTALRYARTIDVGMASDPRFIKALDRMAEAATLHGRARRAAVFEANYGRADQTVIAGERGEILIPHDELNARLQTETIDDVLNSLPPGAREVRGEDGVYTVAQKWYIEQGVPPSLARKITRAWDQHDTADRIYDKTATGEDWTQIWSQSPKAEPGLEIDALGQWMPIPNVDMGRKATSAWRKAYAEATDKSQEEIVDMVYGALAEEAMRAWKDVMLTGLGLRIGVYALRNTLDTHITAALNGGSSVIRSPQDLISWALTSSVRKAQVGDGSTKMSRARASIDRIAQATADNPIVKMMLPDQLQHDINGNPFVNHLDDLGDGVIDMDGLYNFSKSLNMGAVGRGGSAGRDVGFYQRRGLRPEQASLADKSERGNYLLGLAHQIWRLAKSPAAAKKATLGAGHDEDLLRWFMYSTEGGRAVLDHFGPDVAATLATREGSAKYIEDLWNKLVAATGGDSELLDVIASSGKFKWVETKADGTTVDHVDDFFVKNHSTGDIQPHKEFLKLLERKVDEGINLPETVHYAPNDVGGAKNLWDRHLDRLYHWAGKIEDVWAREPFFKERFFAHAERAAPLLTRKERQAWIRDLRSTGDTKLAERLEKLEGPGGLLTREELNKAASWLAYKDMRDVAYNAADRREWAYALRFISPFIQAAVNGMYRWGKGALKNPETDYRILRAAWFLTGEDSAFINDWLHTSAPEGSAFIYEDQYGQRRVSLPGTGLLSSVLGTPADTEGALSLAASSLNFAFPGYERADLAHQATGEGNVIAKTLFPGFGPAVNIPLQLFSDGTSEWARDYLEPFGTPGQGFWDVVRKNVVPSMINRVVDTLKPDAEEERRRVGRAMQFYAMIIREEGGLTNMTKADQKDAFNRAVSLSNSFSWVELLANTVSPGATGTDVIFKDIGDIPDHFIYASQVGEIYRGYIDANKGNYAKAEAEFVNDVGIDLLALTAPSSFNTDAAPPTRGANAVKQAYEEGYEKYGPILGAILPTKGGPGDFDPSLYAYQIGYGERILLTPEQRIDVANQRILDYIYAHNTQRIANADADEMDKTFAMNGLKARLQRMGWDGLDKGRTMQEKQLAFNLMEQAARDPQMQPFIGQTTSKYLVAYLEMRKAMIRQLKAKGLTGDLAGTTTSAIEEKTALLAVGETMASKDKNFRYIWWYALRSEVVPEEEEG